MVKMARQFKKHAPILYEVVGMNEPETIQLINECI